MNDKKQNTSKRDAQTIEQLCNKLDETQSHIREYGSPFVGETECIGATPAQYMWKGFITTVLSKTI